ncbi:MAG: GIY-YIG nuclease family protein [Bacteroidales bacterium]|nr:GIY-YIG nuclease family protein [Bacteroidales bacterium]
MDTFPHLIHKLLYHGYVYILICNENSYYTGWTHNLNDRLSRHQKGNKSPPPLVVIYSLFSLLSKPSNLLKPCNPGSSGKI